MSILKLRNFLGQTAPRFCHYDALQSLIIARLYMRCRSWTQFVRKIELFTGHMKDMRMKLTFKNCTKDDVSIVQLRCRSRACQQILALTSNIPETLIWVSIVAMFSQGMKDVNADIKRWTWMTASNEVSSIAYQWLWETPHFGSLGSVLLHRHHHSQKGKEKQCQVSYVLA